MTRYLTLILLTIATFLVGCNSQIGDYAAASSVSNGGFARDGQQMQALQGQEVKLWGFVDHSNLYGDERAQAILQEWWGGEGPDASTWRFNLKAAENDEAGASFPVYVPNDSGRDDLLRTFVADARAQRPTRVFLKGEMFADDAPTNITTLTSLHMQVRSSNDIQLEPPGE